MDMFRYIEHDYPSPIRPDAIDLGNDSEFQNQVADLAVDGDLAGVRQLAEDFVGDNYDVAVADPTTFGEQLDALWMVLAELDPVTTEAVEQAIIAAFDRAPARLSGHEHFQSDRRLLQNAALAVKLSTGFGRTDARQLARRLQASEVVRRLSADSPGQLDRATLTNWLNRPLRVPASRLPAVRPSVEPVRGAQAGELPAEATRISELRVERGLLESAYQSLLGARRDDLEIVQIQSNLAPSDKPRPSTTGLVGDRRSDPRDAVAAPHAELRLSPSSLGRFEDEQLAVVKGAGVDLYQTSLPLAIAGVEQRLAELNEKLLPLDVPTPATIFQLGGQFFARTPSTTAMFGRMPSSGVNQPTDPHPNFHQAITRPVGVGNLRVARQQLIGYEPGEVSHVENVLVGEELRRWTERTESSETYELDDTTTTRTDERDRQTTDRNELASEAQREVARSDTGAGDGMISSTYGRLVENGRSNFAQTVVATSVERVTQEVRRLRTRRERRSYTEHVEHTISNPDGPDHVRGIYQWVDKRYCVQVMDYGKRLMYDVVVPEPASVLTEALERADMPVNFELTKPSEPRLRPGDLNATNYRFHATTYGVTGSVTPPPQVYAKTIAEALSIAGGKTVSAYGDVHNEPWSGAFKLKIPEGYRAISGYIQTVNPDIADATGRTFEAFVGAHQYLRIDSPEHPYLNDYFRMADETGEVPVTIKACNAVTAGAFAIGLICQRTDDAYSAWQLKTHATILSGYQRQLAEFEDKLARHIAAARAQLAAAGGLARDPSIVLNELKRAFTFLLLGEHPATWLATPPPPAAPPTPTLPNPAALRDWGAVVAFFERAFEWENLMYSCYPYYWGRTARWEKLLLMHDLNPEFEAFLKAGAARVVVPVRRGFEAALAHFHETGEVWLGKEIPDMFSDHYLSIIDEVKAANRAPGAEVCVEQWEVTLPTTLVWLKEDPTLPSWAAPADKPEP